MAKAPNPPAEAIQSSPAHPVSDAPKAAASEPRPMQRLPFEWWLVFVVFAVCFALMFLEEVGVLVSKLFR